MLPSCLDACCRHPTPLQEVRDKVLPQGGVAPWFEAAALKARSLAVVHALEEVGRCVGRGWFGHVHGWRHMPADVSFSHPAT